MRRPFDIVRKTLPYALPIMAGYVAIGIPAGILEGEVGISAAASFVVSITFYSGAGQFMFSNMVMAGSSPLAIIASISFVNTRQILYSVAFAPFFSKAHKVLTFLFSATVTDESFGVNLDRFTKDDEWTPVDAFVINIESMLSWAFANAIGAMVGALFSLPTAITSFAMTSIFICLLVGQRMCKPAVIALVIAVAVVVVCKCTGLGEVAVFVGAVAGVAAGSAYEVVKR